MRLPSRRHGQVGGQENKREAERAPGGVPAGQGDRQLHQVVTGDDDQDVEQHQCNKRITQALGGVKQHDGTFLLNGVREPMPSGIERRRAFYRRDAVLA